MRLRFSILGFVLACVIGVNVAYLWKYAVDWYLYMPKITGEEVTAMVGRRVRHLYLDDRFAVAKCPASIDIRAVAEGVCTGVARGERGSIIRVEEWTPQQYFLVVQWDEPNQGAPMLSYIDSAFHRFSLEAE